MLPILDIQPHLYPQFRPATPRRNHWALQRNHGVCQRPGSRIVQPWPGLLGQLCRSGMDLHYGPDDIIDSGYGNTPC